MKKTMCSLAAVAVLVAGSASAQVCSSFPAMDGQGTVSAFANFPDGFDQYGAEASYNTTGPLTVAAGFIHSTGGVDENTFRGGLAFDVTPMLGRTLQGLSICPLVRADYTSEGGATRWQVPLGVGFGVSVPVGSPDMTLTPYVIPALVWTRIDLDGFDESDTDFGIRGGADLNFDRFFLGGLVEWLNVEGVDPIFGVRAGIKF